MKSGKVLLIIPAYNEAKSIESVVNNIIQNYPQYDYLIINDGSRDNTAEICERNHYNYVSLPLNLGIGGAVQTGYLYALKNNYSIAIQIDGDGQHDIQYVEKIIEPLLKGEADIAIGSRFITKEGFQSSVSRRLGIQILSKLILLVCFKNVKDVTSGFRAVNQRFIKIYAENYPNDYPEPEAIVIALVHGGKIKEIPVVMLERENGTSSINFWKSIYYMIKVTLAIVVSRISFGVRRGKKI
ncbi:MAG: glycosyltransferase family 2 protein [Lachnospiraceae bacterium]|nr:glycosyltransferase family 2 protein [Lachnospiraceae bacterium]